MDIDIYRSYTGKPVSSNNVKVEYDRSNKKRPAWIYIEGLPRNTFIISTRINNKIVLYKVYLTPKLPLFLPVNYTKEEMKNFYDKFSETYDKYIKQNNLRATRFLLKKIKLTKNAKILDLGAGTGIGSLVFAQAGYKNITLLDCSKKMLLKAREKKELKKCKFIFKDIRKLDFNKKFDAIISIFSFALSNYFDIEEIPLLCKKIAKSLKPEGILVLLGHDFNPPRNLFNKIESGKRKIIKNYKANWYIGSKKKIKK